MKLPIPHFIGRSRDTKATTFEARCNDRDVVGTTLVVRHRDQAIAGHRKIQLFIDHSRHVFGTHLTGKTIAAE